MLPSETSHFFQQLTKLQGLEIEGILTHLADTNQDNPSGVDFTHRQAALFNQQIDELHNMGIHPLYRHLANSAAIIGEQPDTFNLVRPGIMLYGAYPAKSLTQMNRSAAGHEPHNKNYCSQNRSLKVPASATAEPSPVHGKVSLPPYPSVTQMDTAAPYPTGEKC